jgi:DNA-binding NarL/FixJ family response regulator
MPQPIPILIADAQEVVRHGLRAMLAGSRARVVGEAADAPTTLVLAKKHRPAVVVLDVAIPGGDAFDLAGTLARPPFEAKVVLLSTLDNPTYMARACAINAAHCLLKDVGQRDLVAAIEDAFTGRPAPVSVPYGRITASLATPPKKPAIQAGLTPREAQVLVHVAYGLSNEEVALGISVETVKEHVQNILRKLSVRDRTQAAVWAVRSGMV